MGKKVSDLVVEDVHIVACAPTLLLSATQEDLKGFLSRNIAYTAPISAITSTMISDKLSKIPFLCEVKESQLNVLAAMCRYEAIDTGQAVFEEGSLGSKLYIVLDGEVSVHTESRDSHAPGEGDKQFTRARALRRSLELQSDNYSDCNGSTCVARLGPGDYFGETSLLVNIPRTLTVTTENRSLFLTVEKVDFENFLKVCSIKSSIDRLMKSRMVLMLSSLGIPFFVGLPTEKLTSISKSLEIHEIEEGSVVFNEGAVGDRFYIIFYGEVAIETSTEKKNEGDSQKTINLGKYGPGAYFGEMALISDSPRSATVYALGKTILLSIEKKSFRELFLTDDGVLAEFQLRVLQGRSQLHHLLSHSEGVKAFRAFLTEECADENLDFWEDCNSFQQSSYENKKEVHEKAKYIFDRYCIETAEKEVNISSDERNELLHKLNTCCVSLDMFEESQIEIYNVMNRDNYARFKTSDSFKTFFGKLGIALQ